MKKLSYLWTLLLALMVGVSFVSCDDDDEGDVGAPKELLGTWLWYGEEITFNANGSGVLVEDGESYPFSFTYDAASKTLTVSADGEVMRWTIVSISNSKMVAVDEDGYEDVFLRPGASGGDGEEGGGSLEAPEYDTSAPVDLPNVSLYTDVSGKYEVNTSEIPYSSIELTADGYYVATKASSYPYSVKAVARKAAKVGGLFNSRSLFKRNLDNEVMAMGRFEQVDVDTYVLEGFCTLVAEARHGNGDVSVFAFTGNDGLVVNVPVQKAENVASSLSGNTKHLCRMWKSVEERVQYYVGGEAVYDGIYRLEDDVVTVYVNPYEIDWVEEGFFDTGSQAMEGVLFSQAGTYLQVYRDGFTELTNWRWEDESNGILYGYDVDDMFGGGMGTFIFYGNRVNVVENYAADSEEAVYTTVLEAAP